MDRNDDKELAAMVAEQAGRLFQQEVTRATLEAADRGEPATRLWEQVVQAGLPEALVPEAQGGSGLGGALGCALVRLAAFHALPLPLGETLFAKALWCAAGGSVGAGSSVGAGGIMGGSVDADGSMGAHGSMDAGDAAPLALACHDGADAATLRRDGQGWRLSASLASVPFGRLAGALLLFARNAAGGGWLVRLPAAGVSWVPGRNLANEARDGCELQDVPLAAEDVLAAPAFLSQLGLRPVGALLRAQQMVGAMDRCLELALAYAGERVQFGRAISNYAPVQFMLVEAAGELAAAAAAAEGAAEAWDTAFETGRDQDFLLQVAAAKSRAGEAAGRVAAQCHQVHGAIGFTQEHTLHHLTRRLWSWRDEAGSESWWNEWLGRQVCARGGAALWPTVTAL